MDKSARALIATTLVVYVLALAALVLYSLHQFPAQEVLGIFQRRWITSRALYLFIEHLIPIQLTAVVITFSLLVSGSRSQARSPFFELVRPVLVVVIVLAFLYTVAVAFAEPALARARADTEYRSELAETFLNQADEAADDEDWARAVAGYEAYLAIDPGADEVEEQLAETSSQLNAARREAPEATPADAPGHEVTSQSADELLSRARRAMAEEDYISGHYWARLALDVEGTLTEAQRREARRIIEEANRRMASLELSNLEEAERSVYEKKRDAYQAWQNGEIFRAHRLFTELAAERENDGDVERYLPRVEEALRDVAFFVAEMNRNIVLPGSSDILFVDATEAGTDRDRFISIGRLVSTTEGTYAQDVEVIDVAADGAVRQHLAAPFAKLREGRFVLQGVERGTEELAHRPAYYVRPADGETPPYIEVSYDPAELHALRDTGPRFSAVGLRDLLMMESFFPRLGYGVDGVRLALLMRLVAPFSFVILSFFAVAAAWAWRGRYIGRPPVLVLLLLPAIPFVLGIVATLYAYLQRVIVGGLLTIGDFTPVLIAAALVQALLLLIALAVLAGQSTS